MSEAAYLTTRVAATICWSYSGLQRNMDLYFILPSYIFFLLLFIYLFIERGRGGEREGEKHQCVVASHVPPTGDLAYNPGMCTDWESNLQPFGSQAGTQSTEPRQLGLIFSNEMVITVGSLKTTAKPKPSVAANCFYSKQSKYVSTSWIQRQTPEHYIVFISGVLASLPAILQGHQGKYTPLLSLFRSFH